MKAKYKAGAAVKFPDSMWQRKKLKALAGGLFGSPIPEDAENKFIVLSSNVIDEETIEYQLKGYPWLVYEEELELHE